MSQKKEIVVTQKMLDEIIPPIQTIEEEIEFGKMCDEEYERSKQEILDVIKRNTEKYKDK